MSKFSIFSIMLKEIVKNSGDKYLRICVLWLLIHTFIMSYIIYLAHHSHSLSFKIYGHIVFFDFLRIIALIGSGWCRKQKPNIYFSFSYEHFEIIFIFIATVLTQIAIFFTLKDCIENFIELFDNSNEPTHSHGILTIKHYHVYFCFMLGYLSQLFITYGLRIFNNYDNPFDKAVSFCGSNHLQIQLMDITSSISTYLPVFCRAYFSPHLFLNRQIGVHYGGPNDGFDSSDNHFSIQQRNGGRGGKDPHNDAYYNNKRPVLFNFNNPFNLLHLVAVSALYVAYQFWYVPPIFPPSISDFIDPTLTSGHAVADNISASSRHIIHGNRIMDLFCCKILISTAFLTLYPVASSMGKILLQTLTPEYTIGQLEKCIREASTLEGVLEITHEHFWVLAFGKLVGSVHVRCKRDADEQLVAAHVTDKLSPFVSDLTVQIVKATNHRH